MAVMKKYAMLQVQQNDLWSAAQLKAVAENSLVSICACFRDGGYPKGAFNDAAIATIQNAWDKPAADRAFGGASYKVIAENLLALHRLRRYMVLNNIRGLYETSLTLDQHRPHALPLKKLFDHHLQNLPTLITQVVYAGIHNGAASRSKINITGELLEGIMTMLLYSADVLLFRGVEVLSFLASALIVFQRDTLQKTYTSVMAETMKNPTNVFLKPVGEVSEKLLLYRTRVRTSIRDYLVFLADSGNRYPVLFSRSVISMLNACCRMLGYRPNSSPRYYGLLVDLVTKRVQSSDLRKGERYRGVIGFLQLMYAFSTSSTRAKWLTAFQEASTRSLIGLYTEQEFWPASNSATNERPQYFDRSIWIDDLEEIDRRLREPGGFYLSFVRELSDHLLTLALQKMPEHHGVIKRQFPLPTDLEFEGISQHFTTGAPYSLYLLEWQNHVGRQEPFVNADGYQMQFDAQNELILDGQIPSLDLQNVLSYLRTDGHSYCSILNSCFDYASPDVFARVLQVYQERLSLLPFGMSLDLSTTYLSILRFVYQTPLIVDGEYHTKLAKLHMMHYMLDLRRRAYMVNIDQMHSLLSLVVGLAAVFTLPITDKQSLEARQRTQDVFSVLFLFHDLNCMPQNVQQVIDTSPKSTREEWIVFWPMLMGLLNPYFERGQKPLPVKQTASYRNSKHSLYPQQTKQMVSLLSKLYVQAKRPNQGQYTLAKIMNLMSLVITLRSIPNSATEIVAQKSLPTLAGSFSQEQLAEIPLSPS